MNTREYRQRDRWIRTAVTPQLSVVENLSWDSGHEAGDPVVIMPAADAEQLRRLLLEACSLLEEASRRDVRAETGDWHADFGAWWKAWTTLRAAALKGK